MQFNSSNTVYGLRNFKRIIATTLVLTACEDQLIHLFFIHGSGHIFHSQALIVKCTVGQKKRKRSKTIASKIFLNHTLLRSGKRFSQETKRRGEIEIIRSTSERWRRLINFPLFYFWRSLRATSASLRGRTSEPVVTTHTNELCTNHTSTTRTDLGKDFCLV